MFSDLEKKLCVCDNQRFSVRPTPTFRPLRSLFAAISFQFYHFVHVLFRHGRSLFGKSEVPLVELFQVYRNPRIGYLKRTLSFGSQYRMLQELARAEEEAALAASIPSASAPPKRRGTVAGRATPLGRHFGLPPVTSSVEFGTRSTASLFGSLPQPLNGKAAESTAEGKTDNKAALHKRAASARAFAKVVLVTMWDFSLRLFFYII
jgi:hypothetical protein